MRFCTCITLYAAVAVFAYDTACGFSGLAYIRYHVIRLFAAMTSDTVCRCSQMTLDTVLRGSHVTLGTVISGHDTETPPVSANSKNTCKRNTAL